jgi:hypothetical protein
MNPQQTAVSKLEGAFGQALKQQGARFVVDLGRILGLGLHLAFGHVNEVADCAFS